MNIFGETVSCPPWESLINPNWHISHNSTLVAHVDRYLRRRPRISHITRKPTKYQLFTFSAHTYRWDPVNARLRTSYHVTPLVWLTVETTKAIAIFLWPKLILKNILYRYRPIAEQFVELKFDKLLCHRFIMVQYLTGIIRSYIWCICIFMHVGILRLP